MMREGGRQGDHSPVPGTNWPEDTHLSAAPPVAVGSMLPNKGMNGRMPWSEWTKLGPGPRPREQPKEDPGAAR